MYCVGVIFKGAYYWGHFQEGLLSAGFWCLRFWGLIFEGGLCLGGGTYFWNFILLEKRERHKAKGFVSKAMAIDVRYLF